ncbi:hypothetical protein DFR86_01120 [Acidianus sulfidivorans JP7]|uniref:Uncharacterized protein n=1 Tax=Acidianus sulfidivorans JP7 TaxID=619593 RepID=A0A2U9IJQ9_9CREN|nr:hypothetical protein [Acidianus sulfidivorans]AWR96279.1 hypothetical protein DFR86_01120 [Acidianus sulfidivorans JP7]
MICEKIGRSRLGKTYILRIYDNGKVEITGDFFTTEEDLKRIEEDLKNGKKPENATILGVDLDELFREYQECRKVDK